tara:strand:+ start:181 stop:453 length:273 start_codon:yes stop_codon:yes gene_type:complete
MVAGDVIGARTSGALTFQPAAGVECMVSTFSPNDAALYVFLQDSAGTSTIFYYENQGEDQNANVKIFISNSLWITSPATGGNSFTGIQIK